MKTLIIRFFATLILIPMLVTILRVTDGLFITSAVIFTLVLITLHLIAVVVSVYVRKSPSIIKKTIICSVHIGIIAVQGFVLYKHYPLLTGAEIYQIANTSMYPTLKPNNLVLVDNWTKTENLEVGDIVLFKDPRIEQRTLIKRLTKIENGKFWFEGDNHQDSIDSRHFGWINSDSVIAKLHFTVINHWPFLIEAKQIPR